MFKTNLKIVITVGFNNQSGVEHVTLYIIIVISREMCGSSESTHFIGNNNNNLLKVNKKLFLRKIIPRGKKQRDARMLSLPDSSK